ncbi:hypothetical protein SFC43_28085 [Bacteroides sp. CR5/BHMF/2]|nr:hypothetical protein [Bacteroides sp. CR5/BHMF/2]
MKKTITTLLLLSCITTFSFAQSIVMTSGTIDFIKDQQVIQFTFSYDEMLVGKLTENEYVEKRVLNTTLKKRAKETNGKPLWYGDRKERFEPKFLELFDKYMSEVGITAGSEGAQYRIEINTDFTEPGWNVGVMRQNASVDLSCKVKKIETGEQVASIKIRNASANNFWGTDFTSGYRVQETYAKAGRELAKFFIKKAKLRKIKTNDLITSEGYGNELNLFAIQINFLPYYCFSLINFVSLVIFILLEIASHLIE